MEDLGFDIRTNKEVGEMLFKLAANEELSIDHARMNLQKLVEQAEEYVQYEGSLTEPGCDGNVKWVVLT